MGQPLPDADPQPKVPVVRRPEYVISLEQATKEETFVHCDVLAPWSPCVMRRLMADWRVLQGLHGGPIRAQHTLGDTKHLKFLTAFGFSLVTTFTSPEGCLKAIYST